MSFNYKKSGEQHSNDSFWTSYSDLFLGLSVIFLLLYVVSSMRQGADSIKQQVVSEQLAMENNDLKNQLNAYEEIKNQYMKDQASTQEKDEYNELVDKLSLLQEENQSENDKLKKQLLDNSKKEASLNKYQQMVRNMLNANKLAKIKINTREVVIDEKIQVIEVNKEQISGLEKEVGRNKQLIAKGEKDISDAKKQLDLRLNELRSAYKNNKITRIILEKRMAQANLDSRKKVDALVVEKQKYQEELSGVTQKLNAVSSNLDQTKGLLDQKTGEAQMLQNKVEQTLAEGEAKIAGMKAGFAAQQAREKAAFEGQLGKLKLSAAEKERREGEFRAAAAAKVSAMNAQISGVTQQLNAVVSNLDETKGLLDKKTGEAEMLQNKVAQTAAEGAAKMAGLQAGFAAQQAREKAAFDEQLGKMKLGAAERERRAQAFREAASAKEDAMRAKMGGLEDELASAKAELEARKMVAKDISKSFAKAGIKAEINEDSGEVILDFGESYFDSGSSELKNEMKNVIEKAVPIYAKSLLGNAKISDKVSAVEIIGYASPTYKGRFVDPKSDSKDDQKALKYNMDLSYSRAKSIFDYMIDNQKNETPYNKNLMSLMKVSGRSFLEASNVKTNVSPSAFCKVNDCKKAQRVVIRFSMDKK